MSLGPLAQKNNSDCLEDNRQVEQNRKILDVKEVELEFELSFFQAGAVFEPDLGPSGKAWPHTVTLVEQWNLAFQERAKIGDLRPWTDQAHFTPQHVNELRQL